MEFKQIFEEWHFFNKLRFFYWLLDFSIEKGRYDPFYPGFSYFGYDFLSSLEFEVESPEFSIYRKYKRSRVYFTRDLLIRASGGNSWQTAQRRLQDLKENGVIVGADDRWPEFLLCSRETSEPRKKETYLDFSVVFERLFPSS